MAQNQQWQERLFGRKLVKCETVTKSNSFELINTTEVLKNIDFTGIYFSFANIKLHSDEFAKKLKDFYERINASGEKCNDGKKFEVVQVVLWANNDVYSDFEQSHTDSLLNLPWFAMPFSEIDLKVRGNIGFTFYFKSISKYILLDIVTEQS